MSTLRLPDKEYAALCKAVLERDHWKCRSCQFRGNLAAHHIVYRSHQGEDTAENLITLCNQCHEAVHRSDLEITKEMKLIRHNGWKPC